MSLASKPNIYPEPAYEHRRFPGQFSRRFYADVPCFRHERVREIELPCTGVHGEPIVWCWESVVSPGIADLHISLPDWGDARTSMTAIYHLQDTTMRKLRLSVFWECGVMTQKLSEWLLCAG